MSKVIDHPLSLYVFMPMDMQTRSSVKVSLNRAYTVEEAIGKVTQQGFPNMQLVGSFPLSKLLEGVPTGSSFTLVEPSPEVKELSREVLAGSLELSIEKHGASLTDRDKADARRIITKIRTLPDAQNTT